MQQTVLVSIRFRVTKKPMCAHTPAGCLKPGKQVRIYLGKMRCLSRARNLDGARLLLRRGPGRWQARLNLRMQAGGSHVDVHGCASLAHVGYLNAGLASHASEIQVARRSRSGSGSTQMYVQVVCTPVSK